MLSPAIASRRRGSTAETSLHGSPARGTKQNHRRVDIPWLENSIRKRIADVEIVEQPSVERRLGERGLDFLDAAHRDSRENLAPHAWTRSGSIRTSGFRSDDNCMTRY